MDVVVTHEHADFDALASLVASARLFPSAQLVRPRALNRNVREYLGVHGDELPLVPSGSVDLDAVSRLIVVETTRPELIGPFAELLERAEVEVLLFDHHSGPLPQWVNREVATVTDDGALTTALVSVIAERRLSITPGEATLFALGIHEDTLSLTSSSTTERDVEALAWCLRQGANQGEIAGYINRLLDPEHRDLFEALLESVELLEPHPLAVLVSTTWPQYIDDVASIATKLLHVIECDALVCLVEMGDRTVVAIRSTGLQFDAGALTRELGGGGHPVAASAMLHVPLGEARARLTSALAAAVPAMPTAGELMSTPARFVAVDDQIEHAMSICQRHQQSAIFVGAPDDLRGAVTREDLDRALGHGLASAPVSAIARRVEETCSPDTDTGSLQVLLGRSRIGRLPVIDGTVVGVVARGDLVRALGRADVPPSGGAEKLISARGNLLAQKDLETVFEASRSAAGEDGGVFLVGGVVRDLLLGQPVTDIDIAVEGDGIAYARRLASSLGGRVVPHDRFGTAVILHVAGRVDVASTRSEFYEQPAALPAVEDATIHQDLGRRDFTINAMAVSLSEHDYGRLVDPFGGQRDLDGGVVRVLHSLSFIDDPTRIFRAVRYESRYGFAMDTHTQELARTCIEMGFVGEVSPPRVGEELLALLAEDEILAVLKRLEELNLGRQLHAGVVVDDSTRALVARLDPLRVEHRPDLPAWRLRMGALVRQVAHDEIRAWLTALNLRRRDSEAIEDAVRRAPDVVDALEYVTEPFEARERIEGIGPDGLMLAIALADDGAARRWLERYLHDLGEIELTISGEDVISMGLAESPQVGAVMRELLRLKVNGELAGRAAELETARRLIDTPDDAAAEG